MPQKVELIGGFLDGMVTHVESDQQQVTLYTLADPTIRIGDELYPDSEVKTNTQVYRRRLKDPRKFDWVKP